MGLEASGRGGVADPATGDVFGDLRGYRFALRDWLDANRAALPPAVESGVDFTVRLDGLRTLQRSLYEAGWAQCGWPVEIGGRGGDARHRAVLYEELSVAGHPSRSAYEHLEILAPALLVHWDVAMCAEMFPRLLHGSELWSQGFSEPDAGSDLLSLRSRAVRDGDGYRLTGRKIWTSWASYARRCVVLARTGAADDGHRGLSTFFVDLDSAGVEVRSVPQANGLDELAEVTFDDVFIPKQRRIGDEGRGWSVAMDVLSCERSAFAWLRHIRLLSAFDDLLAIADPSTDMELGGVALDLFAVRCASARAVEALAEGRFLGAAAAPVKVLLTTAEQRLYNSVHHVLGPALALGHDGVDDVASWQEDYLFSRAVSIYGGSLQMQYTTIARRLLGLPSPRT